MGIPVALQNTPLSLLLAPRRKQTVVKMARRHGSDETVPMLLGCAGVFVELETAELEEFRAGMRFAGAIITVSALAIFVLLLCSTGS